MHGEPTDVHANTPHPAETEQEKTVAVVVAGAGARGAYEAGALSVLIPWLTEHGRKPSVFVGTSAGAINAVLFAAVAHCKNQAQAAQEVLNAWRSLTPHTKVFRSPCRSALVKTLPAYLKQIADNGHVVSLLDTTPMLKTAQAIFTPERARQLRHNIHGKNGAVKAVAVAATSDTERTTVFIDKRHDWPVAAPDPGRAIDYEFTPLTTDHVLASCAIPVFFPPVTVNGRAYIDGGVRLNTPLEPAINLHADEVVVVATHPATYPTPDGVARTRDAVDGIVTLLDTVLADRMVEDLHTLERINQAVRAVGQSIRLPSTELRYVRPTFVGPTSRHELGQLAEDVFDSSYGTRHPLHSLDLWLLHWLIGAREQGAGDLLSYLFFERDFVNAAIALGICHAQEFIRHAPAASRPSPPPPAANRTTGRAAPPVSLVTRRRPTIVRPARRSPRTRP